MKVYKIVNLACALSFVGFIWFMIIQEGSLEASDVLVASLFGLIMMVSTAIGEYKV